eukprot:1161373-Pelagomonas_calceolata.AAC.15
MQEATLPHPFHVSLRPKHIPECASRELALIGRLSFHQRGRLTKGTTKDEPGQEYSALDQFCGRFPSKAVREMAGDAAFMASLLGSLSPSISPTTPCIAAVVLGLQVGMRRCLELGGLAVNKSVGRPSGTKRCGKAGKVFKAHNFSSVSCTH